MIHVKALGLTIWWLLVIAFLILSAIHYPMVLAATVGVAGGIVWLIVLYLICLETVKKRSE